MQELIKQAKTQKFHRKNTSKFLAICTVAFIYGSKSYNFLRTFLPLPHEKTLRKWYSPEILFYIKTLTEKENIPLIINEFIQMDAIQMNATIAVDAAKFKDVRGEEILEVFPFLKDIIPDHIYNNIFVYYFQPVNVDSKPFPVYVKLSENGSANYETIRITNEICDIIEQMNIKINFVATDGDHKFDKLHELFFKIILDGFKSRLTFKEIIYHICHSKIGKIPINDFFHSIKNLRSYLIKYGVEIDHFYKATVFPESLVNFDMKKALTDITQSGKMKDSYPLEIFAEKNILKVIESENWDFFIIRYLLIY